MKNTITLISALFLLASIQAQDITGQWNGLLKEINLRLVLRITETDAEYSATLESPDQSAVGMPVTAITFSDSTLIFSITQLGLSYTGQLENNVFKGTFSQAGMEIPLNLSRETVEKQVLNRPQHPVEPFPYYSENVTFTNEKAKLTLAGTLTLPKKEGTFPVVILITGSGPQDRNEEIAGHKPFLVIADHLTKNGIGVLRYDERGVGESTGTFETATSADFAADVHSAITYLKTRTEIDPKKIGLIGHSEGGLIAPMVASESKDVDFIVLLAGPGLRGDKILLLQQELIARASGSPEVEIQQTKEINTKVFELIRTTNPEHIKSELTDYLTTFFEGDAKKMIPEGMTSEEFIEMQINQITTPWMLYFFKYDPVPVLQKVDCAVLALNGEKDLQVP
ncbi:MAG: alpha/beta fold hydrolase, partial [Flavobacteriaceae bacterium]